jgi:hypothetical protein
MLYAMKKIILIFSLIIYSILCFSQDIVYDPVIGNKEYWRRIKVGPSEIILNTYFQNRGIINKSKVLMAAGIWDGLVENIDYAIIPLEYDTIVFEFKSDEQLNLNIYRYYYNETYFYNFIGLRKAQLGDDMFTGQYLFICPISPQSQITIYSGIGNKKKQFLILNGNEITESSYIDYNVDNEMTFKIFNGQQKLMRILLNPSKNYIFEENDFESRITVWPNPVRDILHIKIVENPGLILRIYSNLPLMKYEVPIEGDDNDIDVSSYPPGIYIMVFMDKTNSTILHTIKMIKK